MISSIVFLAIILVYNITVLDPVQPYHPPLYDVIGERATLDQIKEAVVISKCRPTIPGLWYSDKVINIYNKNN